MNKEKLISEIEKAYEKQSDFKKILAHFNKVIILGNGGSNSIASHTAQDYTKQLGKKAFTFSDPSRLTCYINDYGMEFANEQFVKEFADLDTLVIIISSSGNSMNMINVMHRCSENKIPYMILTGFDKTNKMRKINEVIANPALLDVWVDSTDYGIVEITHQVFLHSVLGD